MFLRQLACQLFPRKQWMHVFEELSPQGQLANKIVPCFGKHYFATFDVFIRVALER